MGRLKSLGSTLSRLPPRLARRTDDHGHSKTLEPWRAWFSLKRWKDLRAFVLLRDLFTCQRCNKLEGDTSQLVADHITPHRGDPSLFWDPQNLQTLCKPCHDGAKQRDERRSR